MPDDNAPKYDPEKHTLVRDWCWQQNQDIADVLHWLHKKGVPVFWVQNPYAEALSQHYVDGVSECYSPTVRAINIENKGALDEYEMVNGPRPLTRDLTVTFKELKPGQYGVFYDDPGLAVGTWYIDRPADLKPKNEEELNTTGKTQVSADSFDFPPCIELDTVVGIVTAYGLAKIMDGPLTINGVACMFHEAHDSQRSKLPGGWRYGKFNAGVSKEEEQQMVGGAK